MTRPSLVLDTGRPGDLDAMLAIERRSSSHPWSEALCAAALTAGPERTLVVRAPLGSPPGVVAFCVLAIVPAAGEAEVRNVAVHPDFRRRGLARLLLSTALRIAGVAGARRAFLEVRETNGAALGLYAGLGFVETGRRRGYYAAPREDAVLMALTLPEGSVDRLCGVRYSSTAP